MHCRAARHIGYCHELVGIMIGGNHVQAMFPAMIPGKAHMCGFLVLGSIYGCKGNAQLQAGLHDADGDFTTVANKDSVAAQFGSRVLQGQFSIWSEFRSKLVAEPLFSSKKGLLSSSAHAFDRTDW